MPTETRWVIVYECPDSIYKAFRRGLYSGSWLTRHDAITEHCAALDDVAAGNRYKLTPENRKRTWQQCRRRGDRAVKAQITWDAPKA